MDAGSQEFHAGQTDDARTCLMWHYILYVFCPNCAFLLIFLRDTP
jgi:hypothetical protein